MIKHNVEAKQALHLFLGVKITQEDRVLLDAMARATGVTKSEIIRLALRRFLGVEASESPDDENP